LFFFSVVYLQINFADRQVITVKYPKCGQMHQIGVHMVLSRTIKTSTLLSMALVRRLISKRHNVRFLYNFCVTSKSYKENTWAQARLLKTHIHHTVFHFFVLFLQLRRLLSVQSRPLTFPRHFATVTTSFDHHMGRLSRSSSYSMCMMHLTY